MTDYLSTKSSESLGLFYEAEDNYNTLLDSMRLDEESEHVQMMLADVRHLSGSYLAACESALSAKRGRNIQKYKDSYDEATRLYEYVSSYLYSLNNVQLGNNSTNYSALRQSFHSLEMVTLLVLALVTLTNLLITLALTKALTDPLSILARQADEISAGNFSVPALEVRSEDEIGTVSAAFNEMVVSIRGYIEQLRTSIENENRMKEKELLMDAHLKEAELKYLQA